MTDIGFYAPLKPPNHPTPSGDREMARALSTALQSAGYVVDLVSDLRAFDAAGNAALQSEITDLAKTETARILQSGSAWAAWVTYHSYYKSPDLIGPAVSKALGIPYLQIESTRARKRLNSPWAPFAAASEAASDEAAAIFYMTLRDKEALQAYAPSEQTLVHLPPFLQTDALPPPADAQGPSFVSIGMFRSRAKLESYKIIADTLPLLATPDWHLTIIGDGPEKDAVTKLFAPFGQQVQLTGALTREQVQVHLHAARALFWPGVGEAYGMVYLEAQAAGVPVVAQDRDGVRDVLACTGCDPQQGAACLAARLDQLLTDDAIHARHAATARDTIAAAHLQPQAADILRRTIEDLI